MKQKKRVSWIDIAKGIAIILVVFGHTLRSGEARKIVYAFHVPAFFLLSGMLCKTDDIKKRIKDDLKHIMIPYYIFGIISILIFAVLGTFAADKLDKDVNVSIGTNLWELLYACPKGSRMKFNMPLWFLPCLFATKILYYAVSKLCKGNQIAILATSFGLAALGFVWTYLSDPYLPFNFSVALKMLSFFALGRSVFLGILDIKNVTYSKIKLLTAGCVLLFITAVCAKNGSKVDYAYDYFPNIATFLITALIGSFGICALSAGINNCKVLEIVGQQTRPILLMHKFPVLLFQTLGITEKVLRNDDSAIGVLTACVVSLIVIVMCIAVERMIQMCLMTIRECANKHKIVSL